MLKQSFGMPAVIWLAVSIIFAQAETEPAYSSAITGTQIPSGARRVLPSSVRDEINRAFESLVEAGQEKSSPANAGF